MYNKHRELAVVVVEAICKRTCRLSICTTPCPIVVKWQKWGIEADKAREAYMKSPAYKKSLWSGD